MNHTKKKTLINNLFLFARARAYAYLHTLRRVNSLLRSHVYLPTVALAKVGSSALIIFFSAASFLLAADSVPDLIRQLKSRDDFARQSAAARLGLTRDARAVQPLIRTLKDKKAAVRRQAADSLGLLRNELAIPDLATLLMSDSEPDVRKTSALALSSLSGQDVIPHLISCLKDKNASVVQSCVRVLGQLKAKSAAADLNALLPRAKGALKSEVVMALGKMGASGSVDQIKKNLASSDYTLRYAAIKALGRMNRKDVIPDLKKILNELNPGYRAGALWSLAHLGSFLDQSEAVSLLYHPDPTIRRDVVEAVGRIKNKKTKRLLKDAMELEKDQTVKQTMNLILENSRL